MSQGWVWVRLSKAAPLVGIYVGWLKGQIRQGWAKPKHTNMCRS